MCADGYYLMPNNTATPMVCDSKPRVRELCKQALPLKALAAIDINFSLGLQNFGFGLPTTFAIKYRRLNPTLGKHISSNRLHVGDEPQRSRLLAR